MSKLTKIHKKILANFNNFVADTNQFQLLAKNIELFEKIPTRYLDRLHRNITTFDFAKNNDALLIIAYSYIHYAYENKSNSNLKDSLIMLDKANDCFQKISDSYTLLPPFQLTQIHTEHLLKANFQLHKIKLLKAEMRLFFIEKEGVQDIPNADLMRKELTNIIAEYSKFKRILDGKYKDRIHRSQLSINRQLLESIETGLAQANDLLEKLPRQATAKRQFSETASENNPPKQKNVQRTPKRKKTQHGVANQNDSSSIAPTPVEQIDTNSEHFQPEWDGLAALIAAASSAVPMEAPEGKGKEKEEEEEIRLPSAPQPSIPQCVQDSKTFLNTFQDWSKLYFSRHADYSELEQTEKSLEKIAHSLLLAAVRLKKESSTFKDQQFNPVAKVAVQFLSFMCGVGTQSNLEAIEKQSLLSKTYSPLLKPFIRSFLNVPPEKYIGHLRIQFTPEASSNISFRGLGIQEMVEQLFKLFETVLTPEDYQKVTECCLNGLIQAQERLVEQNAAEFHSRIAM
ncbi:hypothetical protein [Legionella sp. WA2022007384]